MLVSDKAISVDYESINDFESAKIVGGSGYTCTYILQEDNVIFCELIAGECGAEYVQYWERLGCEAAESGSCSQNWEYRTSSSPCVTHMTYPEGCDVTGVWTHTWIRACM